MQLSYNVLYEKIENFHDCHNRNLGGNKSPKISALLEFYIE